jgi:hypothetical protein
MGRSLPTTVFQAHDLNVCEVQVEIPVEPTAPWMGVVMGSEVDDATKKMAHVALTALCELRLTDTVDHALSDPRSRRF